MRGGVLSESRMRDLIAADIDGKAFTRNGRPLALSECRRMDPHKEGEWEAPMFFDFDIEMDREPIGQAWMLDFTREVILPGVRACFPAGTLERIYGEGDPALTVCMSGKVDERTGQVALKPKDLSYTACGKCDGPLSMDAICLTCSNCNIGYDELSLRACYERERDGTLVDIGAADHPPARKVRRFKCGAHIRFFNAPLSCTEEAPRGAGPFVGRSEALQVYSEVLQRAKCHFADDSRFGARSGFVMEDALDPRVYESAGLRVMGTVKMMKCPVCRNLDAFVGACVECGTKGQVVDDRPYVVVGALGIDGQVHEEATRRLRCDTRELLEVTSIRPPPCVRKTPGCSLPRNTPMYLEQIRHPARVDPRLGGERPLPPPSASKHSSAYKNRSKEKHEVSEDVARAVQSYIRALDVKNREGERVYRSIVVTRVFRFSSKGKAKDTSPFVVEVDGAGSHFCANKKLRPGDLEDHVHKGSKIYFLIRRQPQRKRDGHAPPVLLRQCCFCEKEGLHGASGTTCKQWSAYPNYRANLGVVDRDIAMKLFPWHAASTVMTRIAPKSIGPRIELGAGRVQHHRAIAEMIQSAQAMAKGQVQPVEFIMQRTVPRDKVVELSTNSNCRVAKKRKNSGVDARRASSWTASVRRVVRKEKARDRPRSVDRIEEEEKENNRMSVDEEDEEMSDPDDGDNLDAPLFKDSSLTAREAAALVAQGRR